MKRAKKTDNQISFAYYDVERRSAKASGFYNRINSLIDWTEIEKVINRYYNKGENLFGSKPYSGILLFKMLLLGVWNDLSDSKVEILVNDSLSAMRFCNLSLENNVPDHSTLSRFRRELIRCEGLEKVFEAFNKQLNEHRLVIRRGVKVDASIAKKPRKLKSNIPHQKTIIHKELMLPLAE